jgi:hypothetical protein
MPHEEERMLKEVIKRCTSEIFKDILRFLMGWDKSPDLILEVVVVVIDDGDDSDDGYDDDDRWKLLK